MKIQTGIDIVEVPRMKKAIRRWGDDFLKRIFTEREIAYSHKRRFAPEHFAARFAAKEACMKAFGGPPGLTVRWTDVEVLNDADGRPTVTFHNELMKMIKRTKTKDVVVSISHSKEYAIASAIAVRS